MHAELVCHSPSGSAGLAVARTDRRVLFAVGIVGLGLAAAATFVYFPVHLAWNPAFDGPARLGVAALIGLIVTGVQRHTARAAVPQAMLHAQVLLCASGALMMVLISDSLARAFGIAGAASLVRFRTPVDDPRDAAVMFLLIGLGMASGLGAFALAAGGTAMICLFLALLPRLGAAQMRSLRVELVADGPAFPGAHVQRVCARHGVTLEVREVSYGDHATSTYVATGPADLALDRLSDELLGAGTFGLRGVTWEPAKKRLL
jgi:hypothetical protein